MLLRFSRWVAPILVKIAICGLTRLVSFAISPKLLVPISNIETDALRSKFAKVKLTPSKLL